MSQRSNTSLHDGCPAWCRLLASAAVFSLAVLVTFALVRWSTLLLIGADAARAQPLSVWARLLVYGTMFDVKAIASLLLPLVLPLALLVKWPSAQATWSRIAKHVLTVLGPACLFLGALDLGYCLYFRRPVDELVFAFWDDDTTAILKTFFSDVRLVVLLGLLIALCVVQARWSGRAADAFAERVMRGRREATPVHAAVIAAVLVPLLFLGARGGVGMFALSRKTSAISDDSLINALTMNGPWHLYYATLGRVRDEFPTTSARVVAESGHGSVAGLLAAAGVASPSDLVSEETLPAGLRPPHVIFVLMEGWTSQVMLHDGPGNDVLGAFRKHRDEDHFFPYFISNRDGTNPSIEAILIDSPIGPVARSAARATSFRTCHAAAFERAGYETVFLSGGAATWQAHDTFWPHQGFGEYADRTVIARWAGTDTKGPWGIADEYLFSYTWKRLQDADAAGRPFFGFVLTTTNHPPIVLPESYHPGPVDPTRYGFSASDAGKRLQIEACQYAVHELGVFLDAIEASPLRDRVIVVATGDHALRSFCDCADPSEAFIRDGVPAYFRVPAAYDRLQGVPADTVGSHADLFPTIFALARPGAKHVGFGKSLTEPGLRCGSLRDRAWLLPAGVALEGDDVLRPWSDRAAGLLDREGRSLTESERGAIAQMRARRDLALWLLAREYEDPHFDPLATPAGSMAITNTGAQ